MPRSPGSSDGGEPLPPDPEATGRLADSRAAAQGTIALAALQVAGRGLGVVFIMVASRSLGPSQLGRYSIVAALLVAAGFLGDFGTTAVVTRIVSRSPGRSDDLLSRTLPASAALGLASYGAVVGFALVAGYPGTTVVDVAIAAAGLPVDAPLTSVLGALDGRGLITRRALLSFTRVAVTSVAGGVAVLLGLGVRSVMVAVAAGPAVAGVLAVATARRTRTWSGDVHLDVRASRDLLVAALPLAALGGINVLILRFDVVVLSLVSTPAETASYDVALRLVEAVTFVGTVIASPSLFILSRRLGAGDRAGAQRAFSTAIRLAYLLGLPASALLLALHRELVEVFFGSEFGTAGPPLALLAVQIWLAFVAAIQGSLLIASDRLAAAVKIFAGAAVLTVVIDLPAILLFGARGAAGAMVAIQAVIVVAAAVFGTKMAGIRLDPPAPGAVVAAIASGLVAWGLRESVWLATVGGGLAYLLTLLVTRTVTLADLRRVTSLLSRPGRS